MRNLYNMLMQKHAMHTNVSESGAWISSLLMLSIYFSTALDSVATVILCLLWVLSGNAFNVFKKLTGNPILLSAVALFVVMLIGTFYSAVGFNLALSSLFKYNKLIVLLFLCDFLTTEQSRQRMLNAFFVASIITLIGSYLLKFGIIHSSRPEYFFKDRIDHGLFMAFFCFYCCHKMMSTEKYQFVYVLLIVWSVHNIFFICTGRIGQLLCIMLILLFSLQRLSKKYIFLILMICVLFLTLFLGFSEKNNRFHNGFNEIATYAAEDNAKVDDISMHLRLTYWKHALTIIEKKPWVGHGLGSFATEYRKIALPSEDLMGGTPHNEFLMITAQLGVVGLAFFLLFLILQYRFSLRLTSEYRYFAQGVLLTTVLASLFNPTFISHVKGYWLICLIAIPFSSLNIDKKYD